MTCFSEKRGAVLWVVLAVVLCVTLMLSSLLRFPGGVLKVASVLTKKQQAIYDGESEIMKYINGLPSENVMVSTLGPWQEVSVNVKSIGRLSVIAGAKNDSLSRQQKRDLAERFRSSLEREILLGPNIQLKWGNRRLLGRASTEAQSLVVQDGDILVNLYGIAGTCNFKTNGNLLVKGSASFDTLRLFSSGPIQISGSIRINWLEAFSADRVEIVGETRFSGVVASNNQVSLKQHSFAEFPSVLLSVNSSVEYEPQNIGASLLLPAVGSTSSLVPIRWSLL